MINFLLLPVSEIGNMLQKKTGKLDKNNQCSEHKTSIITWKEYTTGIVN